MQMLALRGLAISRFGTLQNFANALGWKATKLSRILSGRQDLTVKEAWQVADVLGVDVPENVKAIFYASDSTNVANAAEVSMDAPS